MSDVAALRAELDALKTRIDLLEARLDARIESEKAQRTAEIAALREEWRNLAQAISANSTAVEKVAEKMTAGFAEVQAEQKHQSSQLNLIGQAMDLLLAEQGLKAPA